MRDPVHILGIHDGHNCGATLTRDGEIVASVCEERLTRRKNEVGYPRRAIEEVLRVAGLSARDLAEIAYGSQFMHSPSHLTNLGRWHRFGNRFLNYWTDLFAAQAAVPYGAVAADRRGARHFVFWHTAAYLQSKGLRFDGSSLKEVP